MTTPSRPLAREPLDHLVVAFDVPSRQAALALADRLGDAVRWAKVGLELFVAAGPGIVTELSDRGLSIFLDLKFHDIPNTVAGACASAARTGAAILNVHAGGGEAMMAAAREGAERGAAESGRARPEVLAVTVLTSLTGNELPRYYQPHSVAERVAYLAAEAKKAGLDGVVCSPLEIVPLREALGPSFRLLTPGLRFADGEAGDQKRVATPYDAARAGSDYLVIGRPITGAADPRAAAARALADIERGLADRR
jgi:orotidine-5'-phosphate decarboxylase